MNDLGTILFIVFVIVYFLPTFVGRLRLPLVKVPLMGLLNALFGWTVVGWIVLMRWALSEQPPEWLQRPEPVVFDPPEERAELTGRPGYEDPDARPEVVELLDQQGRAELVHPESGVQVLIRRVYGEYHLGVPTASLDPRRGQRHRARQAVSEALWRLYEYKTDSQPDLKEDDEAWEYTLDHDDSRRAAGAALRLLCTVADVATDVQIEVSSLR